MIVDRVLRNIGASLSPSKPPAIEVVWWETNERRQITVEHIAGALLSLLLPEDAVSYSQDRLLSEWCKGAAAGVVAAGEARWKTG